MSREFAAVEGQAEMRECENDAAVTPVASESQAARERSNSSASSRTLADQEHRKDIEKQEPPAAPAAQPQPPQNEPDPFLITVHHPLLAHKPKLSPHTWNPALAPCCLQPYRKQQPDVCFLDIDGCSPRSLDFSF